MMTTNDPRRGRSNPLKAVRQRGISLIELMIGMVISLLLIAGMISLFVANKQTYRYNEELARLQENGRFAIDFIERNLRMAGHIGCPELNAPANVVRKESIATGFDLNAVDAITAYQNSTSQPGVVGTMGKTAVPGSDVVSIFYGSGAAATLNGATKPGDESLVIKNNALGFKQGEIVLISTCEQAETFAISNSPASGNNVTLEHKTSGGYNTKGGLNFGYAADARLMRLNRQTFFVGPSSDRATNRQGNAFNSLYVGTTEMVEGVENIAVTYGIPAAAGGRDVNQYVPVTGVTDWNDVLAVKVELLLASVDDGAVTEKQEITFNGVTATMPDQRMYTTYTTTVSLRGNVD